MAPDVAGPRDVEDLEAVLLETLELSKLRMVDSDAMVELDHYLPAAYVAVNSDNDARWLNRSLGAQRDLHAVCDHVEPAGTGDPPRDWPGLGGAPARPVVAARPTVADARVCGRGRRLARERSFVVDAWELTRFVPTGVAPDGVMWASP
ncbi:MAG: hypothetical protein R2712_07010 [Vicinamibacterales bacterium]